MAGMSVTHFRPHWSWVVAAVVAISGSIACSEHGESGQPGTATATASSPAATALPPSPSSNEPDQFKGRLNGYDIVPGGAGLPTRTGFDACPVVGMEPPPPGTDREVVTSPGPLRIDPETMPAGIVAKDIVSAFLCRGDLAEVSWSFFAQPGTPGANPGGSPVFVFRERGNSPIIRGAQRSQWSEMTMGGLAGVAVRPNKAIEPCFAAVYNPATDVQTTVSGDGAQLDLCLKVIEAVVTN